jgi:hypothetical protein
VLRTPAPLNSALGVIRRACMTSDHQNPWTILGIILVTTFSATALTYYLIARSSHLSRGDACDGAKNYPIEVNLHFERIRVNDALELLAGFSCNEFRTNDFSERYIKTDFTNQPWDEVVTKICHENSLACWTEAGKLYGSKRESVLQRLSRLARMILRKL